MVRISLYSHYIGQVQLGSINYNCSPSTIITAKSPQQPHIVEIVNRICCAFFPHFRSLSSKLLFSSEAEAIHTIKPRRCLSNIVCKRRTSAETEWLLQSSTFCQLCETSATPCSHPIPMWYARKNVLRLWYSVHSSWKKWVAAPAAAVRARSLRRKDSCNKGIIPFGCT